MVKDERELPDNKEDLREIIFSLLFEKEDLQKQFLDLKASNQKLLEENQDIIRDKKLISHKNAFIEKENKKLLLRIIDLTEQLRLLRAKQFGQSSERVKQGNCMKFLSCT